MLTQLWLEDSPQRGLGTLQGSPLGSSTARSCFHPPRTANSHKDRSEGWMSQTCKEDLHLSAVAIMKVHLLKQAPALATHCLTVMG